ncbi:hypothetical protein V2G26_017757 [Clonostachys chloroleuca]|uniref:Phosducin domain-containing protein n=1 Tax=Clonostachys chloroleuca TaxID=1926264 RepID=A0AA35Q2C8_9HYPO|nr:unnamed protein product [Clonostachys chloroleuca]
MTTAAQEEFNELISKNTPRETIHPEDRNDPDLRHQEDLEEEDIYRNNQIDAAMRAPTNNDQAALRLPPASFDSGRATGVKGVIADARNFEAARRTKWRSKAHAVRRSIFGLDGTPYNAGKNESESEEDTHSGSDKDEDSFLAQWRESRRRELESENAGSSIRTRRTSPSVREYGRFDEVDAMGYLDAIEKVARDTTVVVFVYDNECEVSATIEAALVPLVHKHRTVHFVKVHYDEIEFDNAAVPSVLAYRHQGNLVANLTGIIEMIPEDEPFTTNSLAKLFQRHGIF